MLPDRFVLPALAVVWLEFALCAVAIAAAGFRLSRYGDVIAEKTGLSGSWIGLIMLATATSLPELINGISAVTVADVPNIAVGDALGSCVFNLVILVVLDFLHRKESIYRSVSQGHVLSAGFGVILIGFAGVNLLLGGSRAAFAFGPVGAYTPVIVLLYLFAMRTIFLYEKEQMEHYAEEVTERYPDLSLGRAFLGYGMAGAVVVAAGAWMPFVASDLADLMGWNTTFVGTLLVAGVTSLPELAVTLGALRIGALDMAMANLLGSNLFDIFVLAVDDLAYQRGPLLSHVSPSHGVSALSAVVMTGIAVVGLLYRPRTRLFKTVGWVSLGLFTVYLLNTYVLYLQGD
jgi:cation:H+ antiporter